jgi:tetratricopeptide (TPR) repeat protein
MLPPGDHCLLASVSFYTNTLPATFMFDDGSPGIMSPRTDLMGIKSIGPGQVTAIASIHTAPLDGADIVSNATGLMQAKKWDEAEKELTRAIQQNPSLGVAYGNRSIVLLEKGRIRDAYQDSLKELSLLPDHPAAYAHVAQCLRLLGRQNEALTNYTRAVLLSGTNMPSLVYEKGVLLSELNRPVEARKEFDQAILLGYTNEWAYYSRGVAFLKEQSFSNAVVDLNAAITKRSDFADAYFARAVAFGRIGQFGMADKDLKEAIRLKPSLTSIFERK